MHPEIRHVVYPVHLDGTRTGQPPRMRHDPDCGHFDWGTGEMLGTPVMATPEQMRMLGACETCIAARERNSRRGSDGMPGGLCPACRQIMPLTGVCDNCR